MQKGIAVFPGIPPTGGPKPLSRIMFDKYDKDKGGTIDAAEFRLLCYDLGYFMTDSELENAIREIDHSGNKQIEYDEFVQWWKKSDRFASLKLDEDALKIRAKAAEVFQQFDADKSGAIDRNEFKGLYQRLVADKLTTKSEADCLADLDANRDGSIQFNEYIAWLQRIGTLGQKTLLASEFSEITQVQKNLKK